MDTPCRPVKQMQGNMNQVLRMNDQYWLSIGRLSLNLLLLELFVSANLKNRDIKIDCVV